MNDNRRHALRHSLERAVLDSLPFEDSASSSGTSSEGRLRLKTHRGPVPRASVCIGIPLLFFV